MYIALIYIWPGSCVVIKGLLFYVVKLIDLLIDGYADSGKLLF